MYPPYPARQTNFVRDANNGVESPSPAGVDSELNQNAAILSQVVAWLRGITNADGTLKNQSSATAQALAGAQRFSATAGQTAFLTSIVWQASFTALNVAVYVSGIKLDSSAVTVANSGGFLQVTIAAQSLGTIVFVEAFESGAGVLTRLGTVGSATNGAYLVGIRDAGGYFTATEVESALQEFYAAYAVFVAAVGNTADLIKRTGAVAFTANQSMGGFRLTNLANGVNPQDAVTVAQFNAYTVVWNSLQSYFLRLDGTTTMSGALAMGSQKITGLANGTVSTDGVNKGQLDLKLSLTGGTMSGPIAMGTQLITGLAPGVSGTDAVNKNQLDAVSSAVGGFATLLADVTTAGLTNVVIPAGVSKVLIEAWGGGGGGATGAAPVGGGGGAGAVRTVQTVTAGDTLNVTVGAGGVAGAVGGDTTVVNGATTFLTAKGGKAASGAAQGGSSDTSTFNGTNGAQFTGGRGGPGLSLSSATFGMGGQAAMGGGAGGEWGAGGVAGGTGIAPGGGGAGNQVGAAGRVVIRY